MFFTQYLHWMRRGDVRSSNSSAFSYALCSTKPSSLMNGMFWFTTVVPSLSGKNSPWIAKTCEVVDADGSSRDYDVEVSDRGSSVCTGCSCG